MVSRTNAKRPRAKPASAKRAKAKRVKAKRVKAKRAGPRYLTAEKTVRRFVERINAHDLDGIVDMLAQDHRFVDSLGMVFDGRDMMRTGWGGYLRMVPDYAIDVERVFVDGSEVVVLGTARGTYTRDGTLRDSDAWKTPGGWMARVRRGEIIEWRVYADNEPIRRRMREGQG
jgi:ketosteroid isomerase-like protein